MSLEKKLKEKIVETHKSKMLENHKLNNYIYVLIGYDIGKEKEMFDIVKNFNTSFTILSTKNKKVENVFMGFNFKNTNERNDLARLKENLKKWDPKKYLIKNCFIKKI